MYFHKLYIMLKVVTMQLSDIMEVTFQLEELISEDIFLKMT